MTRPRGIHVLFMVSLIKNIAPYFLPKNVKNCITTAITLVSLKLRTSCLRQCAKHRYWGWPILWCHLDLPQTNPCCRGNQSLLLNTKFPISQLVQICPRLLHQAGSFWQGRSQDFAMVGHQRESGGWEMHLFCNRVYIGRSRLSKVADLAPIERVYSTSY